MQIYTQSGERILVKDNGSIYTAVPIVFDTSMVINGDECYYSLSTDDGKTFGGYVKIDEESIILYPDENIAENNHFVIRFKRYSRGRDRNLDDGNQSITEEDDIVADENDNFHEWNDVREYTSPDYSVYFDFDTPSIEVNNPEVLNGWSDQESVLSVSVRDKGSYIGRITAMTEDKIVYEEHYGEVDMMAEAEISIPLDVPSKSEKGTELLITISDLALNTSQYSYIYYYDAESPTVFMSGPDNGSALNHECAVNMGMRDNCPDTAYLQYTVSKMINGIITRDEVTLKGSDILQGTSYDAVEDGKYQISAKAYDLTGHSSEELTTDFTIDRHAPVISIEEGSANQSVKQMKIKVEEEFYENCNVSVNVIRTRNNEKVTLPVSTFLMEASVDERSINLINDGDYDIYITATDGVGHVSEAFSSVRIDTHAPQLKINGLNDGEITNDRPVIRVSAADVFYETTVVDIDVVKKNEKGDYESYSRQEYTLNSVSDYEDVEIKDEGDYVIKCVAKDGAGNQEAKNLSFTVDCTAPYISPFNDVDGKYFNTFNIPDNIKSFISDMTSYTYSIFANDDSVREGDTINREGKYMLRVWATDEADNSAEQSASFIIDNTAPQIVLGGMKQDGNIKKGSVITVSLSDEEDMLSRVVFNGNEIDIQEGRTARIEVDEYGDYELMVDAVDPAGNSTSKEIHTSCILAGPVYNDYVKTEKIIKETLSDKNEFGIDVKGLTIGLITVLTGTFSLVVRELRNN